MSETLLRVEGLRIGLRRRHSTTTLVHGVDLEVARGERLGIVGESGSGKTLTMLAVMGLLSPPLVVLDGSIRLGGQELVGASENVMRRVRGSRVAMVYQDPMTALDPMLRVGDQVAEGLLAHGTPRGDAQGRVREALTEVGLAPRIERSYPHELSGGMRQRVMLASALVTGAGLLIADEPTTALDVTIQRQILRLVARLQQEHGFAVAWITHDLGVVAQFAQRVAVMYAGRVVETSPTKRLFTAPEHPYSAALLASLPSPGTSGPLAQIAGTPPDPAALPKGCAFAPRCPRRVARCLEEVPPSTPRAEEASAACFVPPGEWPERASA